MVKKATFVVAIVMTLAVGMTVWPGGRDASAVVPYKVQGLFFRLNYDANNATFHRIAGRLYALHVGSYFDSAFLKALQVLQAPSSDYLATGRLTANLYYQNSNTLGYYSHANKRIYLNTKVWNSANEAAGVRNFAMVFSHEGSHLAFYRQIGFVGNWVGSETTLRFYTESLAWYTHSCRFNSQYTYASLRDAMRTFYAPTIDGTGTYAKPGWGAVWQAYNDTTSPYNAICRTYFVAFGWWLNSTGKVGAFLSRLKTEYHSYNGSALTSTFKNPYSGDTYTRNSTTVTSRAFLRTFGVYANEAYDLYTVEANWKQSSAGADYNLEWKYYYITGYAMFSSYFRFLPIPLNGFPDGYTGGKFVIQPL